MKEFRLPEHRIIAEALRIMAHSFLIESECWFGGGTAIVLKLGEYRRSLDIDFLCSSADGYRRLRTAAVERGLRAFFPEPVLSLREMRTDQYGIRTVISLHGQPIRMEIVRESRIEVGGAVDPDLGVPTLLPSDMFTEKLLANSDRCQDRSVSYRDAFDLGMLIRSFGGMPNEAVVKATMAYGDDIGRKVAWVVDRLSVDDELRDAASNLRMDVGVARSAFAALRSERIRIWPD